MPPRLTDREIASLIAEKKPLGDDFRERLRPRDKRGHRERELDLRGEAGNEFQIRVRQSIANALDFSVILAHRPKTSGELLRLMRYNGRSHQHTNVIEGQTFYGFHIHRATERYQDRGLRADAFAESTERYGDLRGAINCLVADCGFIVPGGDVLELF